jgi:hypothetical protein
MGSVVHSHQLSGFESNLLFCGRGFGLVVGVIVPFMLAVLPYARGRGFDTRSRLLFIYCVNQFSVSLRLFHCTGVNHAKPV